MKLATPILILFTICAATGCTQMTTAANKLSDNTRGAIYRTAGKVQDYTRYDPPSSEPLAPQTAFCYKASSDVICYDTPQANMTHKLVGYQGDALASVMVVSAPVAPVIETAPVAAAQAPLAPATEVGAAPKVAADTPAGEPKPLLQRY